MQHVLQPRGPDSTTSSILLVSDRSNTTSAPRQSRACPGEISSYIQKGSSLPVLLLAHRRAEKLQETLRSLSGVRGFSADEVLVSQDGTDVEAWRALHLQQEFCMFQSEVTRIVDAMNISRITHDAALQLNTGWRSAALRHLGAPLPPFFLECCSLSTPCFDMTHVFKGFHDTTAGALMLPSITSTGHQATSSCRECSQFVVCCT